MRDSEFLQQRIAYVKRNLDVSPFDHKKFLRDIRVGSHPPVSALLSPRRRMLGRIYADVGGYDVKLAHPSKAGTSDIFIKDKFKLLSDLRFRDENRWGIGQLDFSIGLTDRETWESRSCVVSGGTVFDVLSQEEQVALPQNVVLVSRANRNISLALVKIAQEAIRSDRRRRKARDSH